MIQGLLIILKIIGITLLVILGLILLLLALVLFVPVFYKVKIIHNTEKTLVKARASFLFPLLLVTVQYLEKVSYKVKIFGLALLDSDKPQKEKKTKKVQKSKKSRKKKPAEEAKAKPVAGQEAKPVEQPPPVNEPAAEPEEKTEEPYSPVEVQNLSSGEGKKTEKQGFFEKIRCKIQKIRETISNIINKIKKLLRQKDEVQRILAKPETKKALSFVWGKLKSLLKHILPRKIKGYVAYGADDPATTGQVLGVLGVVYAKTGQLLEIRPNFEEKQLACDVELKGRVQLFTLLVIAVKVFLNQELRQLIADLKGLKETE